MNYEQLQKQLQALTEDCPYVTANLANTSAFLYESLPEINWAGFYELQEDRLILGPFQGKPACTLIPAGKGVCGTAVRQDRMQRVENVHEFPGHIACDSASASEIVIPLHCNGKIWGVLDIDSPVTSRFSEKDAMGLEKLSQVIEGFLNRGL